MAVSYKNLVCFGYVVLVLFLWSCARERNPPYVFPETPMGKVPQPEQNIATQKGVELGKRLFFDPVLSANGAISCATCHDPQKAFSDGRALTNVGVSGKPLLRHSPALFNLAWHPGLFWEGGASNMESQVFGPMVHPDEMGIEIKALINKLQTHPEYPALFKEVWGTDSITSMLLARSLAQFERTLLSFGSRFDRVGPEGLSPREKTGYSVYLTHCASCHSGPLFTDLAYHNNGIDAEFTDTRHDLIFMGRYRITLDSSDIGKYKTASLRNLGFTAPYMHDGRFASLDAVLDHYAIDHSGNTLADTLIRNLDFGGSGIKEREALKAFLHTLNDSAFVKQGSR